MKKRAPNVSVERLKISTFKVTLVLFLGKDEQSNGLHQNY